MRKGAGISGLTRQTATASSYTALSTALTAQQVSQLETSLSAFRDALVTFAAKHRADIRKDPGFRYQFQKMCAAIGVDPLAGAASSRRGAWWAEQLGLGEWVCELALQVVDVCVSTRERNGGIIEMGELIARVERMRRGSAYSSNSASTTSGVELSGLGSIPTQSQAGAGQGPGSGLRPSNTQESQDEVITEDDIRRALDLLHPLHAGYTIQQAGGTTFVRSVPRELDTDQSMLLVLASESGGALTEQSVRTRTGWPNVRAHTALEDCVMREGLGWVDEQGSERTVWLIAAVEFE